MSVIFRDADEMKRWLEINRPSWSQIQEEINGVVYDTKNAQPIGELCAGGWVAEQYEITKRLYRTQDGEYFFHKITRDKQSGNITDEIEPVAMENAHAFMDLGFDNYITDAEKDQIKWKDERNKWKRKRKT